MKTLKSLLAILFTTVLVSCSKESVTDEHKNGKFEFLADTHINITQMETDVFHNLKDHRESNEFTPLKWDIETIKKYANSHTEYMISKGEVSKDNLKDMTSLLLDEVNGQKANITVSYLKDGEGTGAGLKFFLKWMDNDEDKEILEGDWTHIAVSVKVGDERNYYATQVFVKIQ